MKTFVNKTCLLALLLTVGFSLFYPSRGLSKKPEQDQMVFQNEKLQHTTISRIAPKSLKEAALLNFTLGMLLPYKIFHPILERFYKDKEQHSQSIDDSTLPELEEGELAEGDNLKHLSTISKLLSKDVAVRNLVTKEEAQEFLEELELQYAIVRKMNPLSLKDSIIFGASATSKQLLPDDFFHHIYRRYIIDRLRGKALKLQACDACHPFSINLVSPAEFPHLIQGLNSLSKGAYSPPIDVATKISFSFHKKKKYIVFHLNFDRNKLDYHNKRKHIPYDLSTIQVLISEPFLQGEVSLATTENTEVFVQLITTRKKR